MIQRLTDASSIFTCKAALGYHALETTLFLYFVCAELFFAEAKIEPFIRFDTRVVLLAFMIMSIPIMIKGFFGLHRGSMEMVHPYKKLVMVSPVINAAYAADLHFVACGHGQCGRIHGITSVDLALALALQVICAALTGCLLEQALFASTAASSKPAAKPCSKGDAGRGVMRLARGCATYEGTIRKFSAERGYGFVCLEGNGKDIYFKSSTCSQEIQVLGEHMVGTPVEFILRWMPDGTPQVRAMLPRKPKGLLRRIDKVTLPPLGEHG